MFSANSSQVSNAANYIEDVFSTYLYTGNGSTQTITNGIDLAGKGGLVWIKSRTFGSGNALFDTSRGSPYFLQSNTTSAQTNGTNEFGSFTSTGFTVPNNTVYGYTNYLTYTYASWTFRKQPKFFDVVTYTGNNATSRQIAHSLGSTPACIIVKCTNAATNWVVYHKDLSTDSGTVDSNNLILNSTAAQSGGGCFGDDAYQTSTYFTLGRLGSGFNDTFNKTGNTYVAYLFAHNAGGFGLTGTDNVISCGTFTTNVSGEASITLGYEPQFVIIKATSSSDSWVIQDNMRGLTVTNTGSYLRANTTDTEAAANYVRPKATGFDAVNLSQATHIYIAIRRPMKVPTSGASVFQPVAYTGTNVDNRLVNTGIVTDMTMARIRADTSAGSFYVADRLRGDQFVATALSDAETTDLDSFMTPTLGWGNSFSAMNGFGVGNDTIRKLNQGSTTQLAYAFNRAPSFFDEVCYTGTGSNTTINHNLGVAPELMIVKERNTAGGWKVYSAPTGEGQYLFLNSDAASVADASFYTWNNTAPTSSVFSLGIAGDANQSGATYVAYLFASCPGVSKIGTFTYPGTSTVDCGFSSGARFVMLKRTSASGGWLVFDTARGIVSGNDPYLELQITNAEVTTGDVIDPSSSGFAIGSNLPNGTYIFLAIA